MKRMVLIGLVCIGSACSPRPRFESCATVWVLRSSVVDQALAIFDQSKLESSDFTYIATEVALIKMDLIKRRALERVNHPSSEILEKISAWEVVPEPNTPFIHLKIRGSDARLCADLANAWAEGYLDFKEEMRMEEAQSTVVSLKQQQSRARDELKKMEDKLLALRESNVTCVPPPGPSGAAEKGADMEPHGNTLQRFVPTRVTTEHADMEREWRARKGALELDLAKVEKEYADMKREYFERASLLRLIDVQIGIEPECVRIAQRAAVPKDEKGVLPPPPGGHRGDGTPKSGGDAEFGPSSKPLATP